MLAARLGRAVALATIVSVVFGLTGAATADTDPVLLAAGDIASCTSSGDEATASLLDVQTGEIAALGDNAYPNGSATDFANCYEPSWGQHKARTHPATGNHEYQTSGASGYFGYFGAAAGDPSKGYYSYDLGAWHIIVLNSTCSAVGGCAAGSPQEVWLRNDLAAHPVACTVAYWHHPRFSSGSHGSDATYDAFWQALYQAGAELVLNGHEHDYERFAPQTPGGVADTQFGVRELVVGTGGASHTSVGTPVANSQVRDSTSYGLLKLSLHASGYDWEFLPVAGATFTDSGSSACHGAPAQGVRTFAASVDARVHEANPSTNYGTSTTLRADGGTDPDVESSLRFAVSGLPGQVTRATLRLYATTGTVDGPAVYRASGSWTQTGVVWTNRPAASGAPLSDSGSIATGSWVEWDVSPAVSGEGTYDFKLQTVSTDGVDFRSREGTTPPQLVVETATEPDTTAPSVAISAPVGGATLSGQTTVSANASDNVSVAGVPVQARRSQPRRGGHERSVRGQLGHDHGYELDLTA